MLDAKRERSRHSRFVRKSVPCYVMRPEAAHTFHRRFLLERKAREEEAAEKLAREERQRKTLAKQREAEAAARKAAKKISNTAPETGPEAGLQDTAAPPPELSSSGRQRTRQEILAVTDLPLEDHLALIVSGGANGEQEAAGAVVPGPTLSGADVAGTTEPLRSARMDKAEVAASSKPPAGRAPPPPMFSRTSNRKLIRNALSHVCLAGAARAKEKDLVLSALDAYKVACSA